MSSVVDKPLKESVAKTDTESQISTTTTTKTSKSKCFLVSLSLRVLLFASTLAAVIVMLTSKQTEIVFWPFFTKNAAVRSAKYSHSPAFIYFVSALWIVCGYSILSTLNTLFCGKRCASNKFLISLVLSDVLMLGILASATGTAGGVAYIGLKGNSHVGWIKICGVYHKFCRHIGASLALSLFASILLVILIMLTTVQNRC
ncbi:Uncharacterized protein family UPF0497 [Macleaya cordata]|uniref:CASP-like protein n=1 Tax=Macleaya cordata TaxID=56857 RepID=A0A200QX96_MACCD|nr:Uncharacterized protein family UPF0497 [Macleaya cordata]